MIPRDLRPCVSPLKAECAQVTTPGGLTPRCGPRRTNSSLIIEYCSPRERYLMYPQISSDSGTSCSPDSHVGSYIRCSSRLVENGSYSLRAGSIQLADLSVRRHALTCAAITALFSTVSFSPHGLIQPTVAGLRRESISAIGYRPT